MEPTIQEAQQALKWLMEHKEQIIDLGSRMKDVCSGYNKNAGTFSERKKNAEINREYAKLRGDLEPFVKANLIHEFISRGTICGFADWDKGELVKLYQQFLIDFQKLYLDLVGVFFDPSVYPADYAVYAYKLNSAFEITPNHFYKIDGRGNPDIYIFI